MSKQVKYVKLFTVQINRITTESNKWYYKKKDEIFNCILIVKQTVDSLSVTPQFLVIEKIGDEFICPVLVRTIRPVDCQVIAEHVVESTSLYDTVMVFGNKNGLEEIFYPLKKAS